MTFRLRPNVLAINFPREGATLGDHRPVQVQITQGLRSIWNLVADGRTDRVLLLGTASAGLAYSIVQDLPLHLLEGVGY